MTSRLCSASWFLASHVYQPLRVPFRPLIPFFNTTKHRATFGNSARRTKPQASDSSSNSSKSGLSQRLVTFSNHPKFDLIFGTIGGALLTLAGAVALYHYQDSFSDRKITKLTANNQLAALHSLEQGFDTTPVVHNVIPRKQLTDELASCLAPVEFPRGYFTIVGEHGTGKTTLVQLILHGLKKPRGSIYMDCAQTGPSNTDGYIDSFKSAIRYTDFSEGEAKDLHRSLLRTFTAAAVMYKERYGKIPVLVVDNANRLAEYQPELLDQLQDAAKAASDSGQFGVIFVSSEGNVPARMQERSAWSRHEQTYRVGDVSHDEALEYLSLRGVDKTLRDQIYDLVGGRMIHLYTAANRVKRGSTFDAIREDVFSKMAYGLERAGIYELSPVNSEATEKAISQLLADGSLDERAFFKLFASRDFAKKLICRNVFSHDVTTGRVTFQSVAMKNFCKEHPEVWRVGD